MGKKEQKKPEQNVSESSVITKGRLWKGRKLQTCICYLPVQVNHRLLSDLVHLCSLDGSSSSDLCFLWFTGLL